MGIRGSGAHSCRVWPRVKEDWVIPRGQQPHDACRAWARGESRPLGERTGQLGGNRRADTASARSHGRAAYRGARGGRRGGARRDRNPDGRAHTHTPPPSEPGRDRRPRERIEGRGQGLEEGKDHMPIHPDRQELVCAHLQPVAVGDQEALDRLAVRNVTERMAVQRGRGVKPQEAGVCVSWKGDPEPHLARLGGGQRGH